jgi:hypothetical protein
MRKAGSMRTVRMVMMNGKYASAEEAMTATASTPPGQAALKKLRALWILRYNQSV